MARVFINRSILARVAVNDGLWKNLKAFIEACQIDQPPPRIYKASGISANGTEYFPYLALNLHHHHLHNNGDPLLITQHVDDAIYGIGLARHADYFQGDKMQWLKDHAEVIDWSGLDALREEVLAYDPFGNLC
jgi:hypothetical protein